MKCCYSCIISFLLWKYGYQASYFPNFTKNWLNWLKIFSNVKLLLLFYLHFCYLLFIIYISLLIWFHSILPNHSRDQNIFAIHFIPIYLSQKKGNFQKRKCFLLTILVILKNFITPIYFLELWVCLLKILGLKNSSKMNTQYFLSFWQIFRCFFFFVLFFVFQI